MNAKAGDFCSRRRAERGFTLVELSIVVFLLSILAAVSGTLLVRYLSIHDEVAARAESVSRCHLFLAHLREDLLRADAELPGFQDLTASPDCLILKRTGAPERIVVYQMTGGRMQREEYEDRAGGSARVDARPLLDKRATVFFQRDARYASLLWVNVEQPSPSRNSRRGLRQRAAVRVPGMRGTPR